MSKVGDTMGFLCDQGTEKAEESGEPRGTREGDEDAADPAGSQKDVSVNFSTVVSLDQFYSITIY